MVQRDTAGVDLRLLDHGDANDCVTDLIICRADMDACGQLRKPRDRQCDLLGWNPESRLHDRRSQEQLQCCNANHLCRSQVWRRVLLSGCAGVELLVLLIHCRLSVRHCSPKSGA
jgi:hypothetical protein